MQFLTTKTSAPPLLNFVLANYSDNTLMSVKVEFSKGQFTKNSVKLAEVFSCTKKQVTKPYELADKFVQIVDDFIATL